MSQHLLIVRGVQGSGKSTFAVDWLRKDPLNRARVNRDDIRFTNFGAYVLPQELEFAVTKIEHALITALLAAGKSVVVDNVNLKAKYVKEYQKIAAKANVPVLHKDFVVDIDVALARNAARDRKVPEDVILTTYKRHMQGGKFPAFPTLDVEATSLDIYVPDESLPKAILLDVDGTAMHMSPNRGPFDWAKVLDDTPNQAVIETVLALHARGYLIVVMSGRDDVAKEDTILSLEAAGVPIHEIHMRTAGDSRKDFVVKKELFDAHIRNRFNILVALDDRNQVVRLYRDVLQLPVFQVNDGDF
jgi:predicted kinase